MANLTRNHPELAEEFIAALQKGITAASKGDATVIKAVNAGGYQVSTVALEVRVNCIHRHLPETSLKVFRAWPL